MYKLIAFDAYGTLFDVYSISQLAESIYPAKGKQLTELWRERQIEYTRLVTISDPNPAGSRYYLSFWEITARALRYSCKRLGLLLSQAQEDQLMGQYAKLAAFTESTEVLKGLRAAGIRSAILSNGSKEMLATAVESNHLAPYLDQIISVADIRLFKTAPQTYGLLLDHFPVARQEVLFVSSNAWDVVGAGWYGFDTFWVNRHALPFEEIGPPPTYEASGLIEILKKID
ncbi:MULTISPECIES: haloacid dehalogenase type II [unclassified Polynucleobacter]|uniref:haloacid dehalogenase type II n=1 Tax=unclassified Polynucleobacter TaxID=2640945 RepID=UPI001F19982E|nr:MULTISPECIES: haloacid dehalogenase type II [unclassified Polynucleobacter]MCE7526375.1 haloacid dehalogenase type II [Polynucleobacter sp. IMCC 30228]MCE7529661.1 haloacid dehalogenase type II [Polynucleobacter sp. IMCC 29146]